MLFFSKKKALLKDLIPPDFVDIHSHLLPGIDDGSPDLKTSLHLLDSLAKIGFSQFITTPHIMDYVWKNTPEIIAKVFNTTTDYLTLKQSSFSIKFASEYMMDGGFAPLYQNKQLLTLKDNLVLIELSYTNAPMNLYDTLFELQLAGYQPVLAHPERYGFYHQNKNEYQKLKNSGCLFQLNLLSTVGYYGENVLKTANYLIENDFFDFVGSDVHHQKHIDSFSKKIATKNEDLLSQLIKKNEFFKF